MSDVLGQPVAGNGIFGVTPYSLRDPVLQDIEDQGRALALCNSSLAPSAIGKAVDSVSGLEGAGIVCRVAQGRSAPRVRSMRLPRAPGDISVCLMFGAPAPAPGTVGANHDLRNELLSGGLSCGAAIFGWIGFLGATALAAPTAGMSVMGIVYDGLAASAASISCINSGVRILNEARGNHAMNARLDKNRVYAGTMRGLDGFGTIGIARGGADGIRAAKSLAAVASGVKATSAASAVIRFIVLDREIKVRLINAVGAAVSLISSNDTGALGSVEKSLGISFTIVLTN